MAKPAPRITADEALRRLKEGNDRFVRGKARFPTVQKEILAELAKGQHPFATILGCSDSRVPPELVFDVGLGELFIIRVAGNVLGPTILGSLQYAGQHLQTPLFVVLGHEGCGAVSAAIALKHQGKSQKSRIQWMIENIVPALDGLDREGGDAAVLDRAVEANVRHTIRTIHAMPEAEARRKEGVMRLVGAVYEMSSGRVRFLD